MERGPSQVRDAPSQGFFGLAPNNKDQTGLSRKAGHGQGLGFQPTVESDAEVTVDTLRLGNKFCPQPGREISRVQLQWQSSMIDADLQKKLRKKC